MGKGLGEWGEEPRATGPAGSKHNSTETSPRPCGQGSGPLRATPWASRPEGCRYDQLQKLLSVRGRASLKSGHMATRLPTSCTYTALEETIICLNVYFLPPVTDLHEGWLARLREARGRRLPLLLVGHRSPVSFGRRHDPPARQARLVLCGDPRPHFPAARAAAPASRPRPARRPTVIHSPLRSPSLSLAARKTCGPQAPSWAVGRTSRGSPGLSPEGLAEPGGVDAGTHHAPPSTPTPPPPLRARAPAPPRALIHLWPHPLPRLLPRPPPRLASLACLQSPPYSALRSSGDTRGLTGTA